ncbi:hypothetical protein A3I36_02245 [Candidatus Giovannonibacteria bacterium RIFCSPLOWO2_02_FULL_45_28]|nr:MAG: hypothetical protein A3I36_02245 [Candidatus Giovannonibacteria bacterium RIFCSPLOWO2_02_FULL_45_28]
MILSPSQYFYMTTSKKLYKIFKKDKIIIGAIHFAPLFGYKNSPGIDTAFNNAVYDLMAFKKGGVDGIIFENNYDIPHKEVVGPETTAAMTLLGQKLRAMTKLPLGINILWNDYRASLAIAETLNLQFVRIPVFVDKVKTVYGVIQGDAQKVTRFQKKIGAENVLLFTDIHVKHAKLLSKNGIVASAKLAIRKGSDALIITGKWTGDSPDIKELKLVRQAVGSFPILAGSGADEKNVAELLRYTDGVIVSTSLKDGVVAKHEINRATFNQRIDINKVKRFVKAAKI